MDRIFVQMKGFSKILDRLIKSKFLLKEDF
jgi:hypothetical protein